MAKFETKAKRIRAPSAIDDEMSYGAPVAWTPERRSALGIAAADLSPAAFETVVGEVLSCQRRSFAPGYLYSANLAAIYN